ncbi:glutaminase A [Allostella humosa]|nr:glutaminase A [Stella humosa]
MAGEHEAYGMQQALIELHERHRGNLDGALADYIPQLAMVEPDQFGVAVATTDGQLFTAGHADRPFTIQSVSKPYAYCIALEMIGRKAILGRVGVEPSGDAFNAIIFDPKTNRAFNPMVNAGAITVAGILYEQVGEGAFPLILDRLSQAAGRPLAINEAVYRSEVETGHRNRAIGHLLRNCGAIDGPVDAILDTYFRQCSIEVTATDLAHMGATLAHIGENPSTRRQVFELNAVRDTLAVMFTCGMYDYSGGWAFNVGIPAKSGVGGGIVGVVNRQLGIGTFSPRLDAQGNSVRGLAAFADLSSDFGLHAFECTNAGSLFVTTMMR